MPDPEKKDWPEVEVAIALNGGTPGLPKAYVNERAPFSYRNTPDIWAIQPYLPLQAIRERLLSDEAAVIVARTIHYHQTQGMEGWGDFGGERRVYALEHAHRALAALADALPEQAAPKEGER